MYQKKNYKDRLESIYADYKAIIQRPNEVDTRWNNGWYERFKYPVVTREHIPVHWRYDLNPTTNPLLLERLGVNATCNSGAIEIDGEIYLMVRTEGFDRKSFFALARSRSGIDGFRFIDKPVLIPETDDPETNAYDMRLVQHEDGWIYGLFCAERKDTTSDDLSAAVAQCGIARTRDLVNWERLPDLKTPSSQQRNAVLHPEFVEGKYAFYTRPMDGFISTGSGAGIAWGLTESIDPAVITEEKILDERRYHTIKEGKNGMGDAPIKTEKGWLHVAHGVRYCAAGMRYVIYCFLCDLNDPFKQIARPGGFFIAPIEEEYLGDVSNVAFINGMVRRDNGEILLYYATADFRMHVARTDTDTMLDYVLNTPEDAGRTHACTVQRRELIDRNLEYLANGGNEALRAYFAE